MACESIPECWLGRVGDIDNGSESPRKGYIKPVFKKDKNMEDIVERFLVKVITIKASKQANKSFATQSSVVWKSHLSVMHHLPRKPGTEGITWYIK